MCDEDADAGSDGQRVDLLMLEMFEKTSRTQQLRLYSSKGVSILIEIEGHPRPDTANCVLERARAPTPYHR